MSKSLMTATFAATALLFAGAALAQTDGSKKELVARILALQKPGIELMAKSLAQQPAMVVMQQAGLALQQMPADRREALGRDIEADLRKYADEAAPIVSNRAVALAPSTIGPMLEERFTEGELREVIAMLESPTVRKFQGMAGDMQKALTEKLVAETKAEIEPKVRAMQQSVSKRLGLTNAAPASAAPAPAAPGKK